MGVQRGWRTGSAAILALTVGVGFPLGLVATFPSEQDGFSGAVEISLILLSLPVLAWMVFVAVTLSMKRRWVRWPAAFSFYLVAGLAARQIVVGSTRNSEFLIFLALLLVASAVALGLLLLPSIEREFGREDRLAA